MDVTSSPSVPVCSAILGWERKQVPALQWQALQSQGVWGWSHRRMAADLACRAAREWCAFASAHPA
jgi:hypothetical protein